MKNLVNGLLGLAAVAFVLGIVSRLTERVFLSAGPVGLWRLTVVLLLFATVLVLIQIRDPQK